MSHKSPMYEERVRFRTLSVCLMVRPPRLELGRSPIRPSNVRVCLFRHGRTVMSLYCLQGILSTVCGAKYQHFRDEKVLWRMKRKAAELNCIAALLAEVLCEDKSVAEVAELALFLNLLLNNVRTYLSAGD